MTNRAFQSGSNNIILVSYGKKKKKIKKTLMGQDGVNENGLFV